MPLDNLEFHTFAAHLHTTFHVKAGAAATVALQLIEATQSAPQKNAQADNATYECFSLVFAGPSQPVLEQKIYTFEHPKIGRFEMFMVPVISRDAAAMHYQCIFNRPAERASRRFPKK